MAFRSLANDRYVSADNAGVSPLIALRTSVGPWETFQWIDLGSGDFALKSAANGLYVTAGSAGSLVLIATRTSIGPWEKFHWQSAASSPNGRLPTFFRDGVNDAPTNAYGRGVGTVPQTSCAAGYVMDAGLCYPDCAAGYYGVGPGCWQSCPTGYIDIGILCLQPCSPSSSSPRTPAPVPGTTRAVS